jgi:hypothetical protein
MADRAADVRTVGHFVRRLRRVAEHPFAANNPHYLVRLAQVPISIGRTSDDKMVLRSPLPNEVAFESLATRLRPFLEPKDDLYFEKAFKALERLIAAEKDSVQHVRNREHVLAQWRAQWQNASQRSERTRAYRIVTVETEYSDVALAYSWLYGDSIHGDHKKIETLEILDRFRAAVGFFSGVAVVAVMTLNVLRQFVELGVIVLPKAAFTDDVVVTQNEIRLEVAEALRTDVGVDTTDAVNALLQQTGHPLPPNVRPVQEMMDELREQRRGQERTDE